MTSLINDHYLILIIIYYFISYYKETYKIKLYFKYELFFYKIINKNNQ